MFNIEKANVATKLSPHTHRPWHRGRRSHVVAVAVFMLLACFYLSSGLENTLHNLIYSSKQSMIVQDGESRNVRLPQCPAQVQIAPKRRSDITERNVHLFKSKSFAKLSVGRLAGAVRVPTPTFQEMGRLGEDKRWDAFYLLEKYFRATFPLLHDRLHLEVINEHGLLYTWQGSDKSLRPILLMGHQDTVPVAEDTISEWKYPPFGGYFDGTYINGRGASDCKNNVIAILSSITALLELDFAPHRTVLLAFGFDEEGGLYQYGAAKLARRIRERYGDNSLALIVDEGAIGIVKRFGRTFAIPQAGEKGYFDAELTVHVPGGHSSIPPSHTSIGILADAITTLEGSASDNFPLRLTAKHPFYTFLQCAANNDQTNLSDELRDAIRNPKATKEVLKLLEGDVSSSSGLHTTQAVTIFNAGSKANALPAYANAVVNYRVSGDDNLDGLRAKLIKTLKPIARKHGLNFTASEHESGVMNEVPEFTFNLGWRAGLEPSPISSTNSTSWKYFSGVIKHVFDESTNTTSDVVVAPVLAGGNTDTSHFWNLSDQIYRFGPYREWHDDGDGGIHDVNERIALDAHLESILFYHELIRVFDEAEL